MRSAIVRSAFIASLLCAIASATGCGKNEADHESEATLAVKAYVTAELDALHAASLALQAAAPAPDADGWNPTADAAAVTAMKVEWKKARVSYERVEGAIAVLFPDLDAATDERYDGFIAEGPDANLFDGDGVTGVHAIERILWADSHPAATVSFESALPNYTVAAFPVDLTQSTDFKVGLCQQLVDDVQKMKDEFGPLALDASAAFRGVIGSIEEQLEKVNLAASGEDESRYAQHTLADMRANLGGGVATFAAFRTWIEAEGGDALALEIEAGFAAVEAEYDTITGEAIPAVPATWNPSAPTPADLATPYGQLWTLLNEQADPASTTSVVSRMAEAADLLGIPELP